MPTDPDQVDDRVIEQVDEPPLEAVGSPTGDDGVASTEASVEVSTDVSADMATDEAEDEPARPADSGRDRIRRPDALLGLGLLWWSVAVAALCFLPLGLVAVAFCLRGARASERGDEALAQRSWRMARGWLIAAIVVGLVVDLFILAVLLLLGAFGG